MLKLEQNKDWHREHTRTYYHYYFVQVITFLVKTKIGCPSGVITPEIQHFNFFNEFYNYKVIQNVNRSYLLSEN